jgi:putative FmdB family regulatory protein
MPTYEYACKSCDEHVEVVQSFKDEPLTECPSCGGPLRKVFGSIGISFKGSGFYKTDSRKSDSAASSSSSSEKADGSGEKTEKSEKSEKTQKSEKTEKAGASSTAASSSTSSSSSSTDSGKKAAS